MKTHKTRICFPTRKTSPDCHRVIVKVDPSDIAYVVVIFEAYDYIGVPRTIDRKNGIVEVLASPDFARDARALVKALQTEVESLEIVTQ